MTDEEINPIRLIKRLALEKVSNCTQLEDGWVDAGPFRFLINFSLIFSVRKAEKLLASLESYLNEHDQAVIDASAIAERYSLTNFSNSLSEKNHAPD